MSDVTFDNAGVRLMLGGDEEDVLEVMGACGFVRHVRDGRGLTADGVGFVVGTRGRVMLDEYSEALCAGVSEVSGQELRTFELYEPFGSYRTAWQDGHLVWSIRNWCENAPRCVDWQGAHQSRYVRLHNGKSYFATGINERFMRDGTLSGVLPDGSVLLPFGAVDDGFVRDDDGLWSMELRHSFYNIGVKSVDGSEHWYEEMPVMDAALCLLLLLDGGSVVPLSSECVI